MEGSRGKGGTHVLFKMLNINKPLIFKFMLKNIKLIQTINI